MTEPQPLNDGSRLTRLETAYEERSRDILDLERTLREQAARTEGTLREQAARTEQTLAAFSADVNRKFDTIREQFSARDRPNWIAISVAMAFVVTLGKGSLEPIYANINEMARRLATGEKWQEDYGRGQIPSSAKGEIDSLRAALQAFQSRFEENEHYMVKGIDKNTDRIDRLEQQAVHVR